MTYTPKRWISLGLGAALLGTAGLAACGGEGGEAGEAGETGSASVPSAAITATETASSVGEGGESGEGEDGETGTTEVSTAEGVRVLSVDRRVAFMSGHVEAGLALYRAGVPEQAAKHLLHPVSETHAQEREGIDALGFKKDVFEQVSAALAEGKPASDVEPLLEAAEENIRTLQANAGGSTSDLIMFLMDVCLEEYQAGVVFGEITEPGEYQDAYGFAVVARDYANRLEGEDTAPLRLELELLVRMWPSEGPVVTPAAAPVAQIASQISRVKLELSTL